MKVLVGGYTKHDSKGIYELNLIGEEEKAQLTNVKNIIQVNGPTYFKQDNDLIFAINKPNDQEGGISVYQKKNGKYQEKATFLTPGSSPAYIGINQNKHLLYTANYHTGIISVFSYTSDDKLTLVTTDTHTAKTLGPRPEQDSAHPHFFDETPAGNLVCCDLGNDSVQFYRLNSENKLESVAIYQNEAGFGTRHLVFSKDGQYFYVVGELSSKINVVKFDEENWKFENIATYSTIPEDWDQHNGAAAIRISKDGKFIYVTNRGNDSIVVFKVNQDHTLALAQRISVFGEFPRDFNWDDSEKYVVVANQNTNNATLYLRNAETGYLTPIQKDIKVPEGTCVLFEK